MEEIIKPLPTELELFSQIAPNRYFVSNYGYVIDTSTNKKVYSGSILLLRSLSGKADDRFGVAICKLVMLTFSFRSDYANHKILRLDCNTNNNHISNLVWDDYTRYGLNLLYLPAHEFDHLNELWFPVFNIGYMSDVNTYGYYVSNKGKIYNATKNNYPAGWVDKCGYIRYDFSSPTVKYNKSKLIHRIVLNTFKYNDNWMDLSINHIDGNKFNNDVNNLEWCDAKYNNVHAIMNSLNNNFGENNIKSKLSKNDVFFILDCYLNGLSSNDICRLLGDKVKRVTISHICACLLRHKEVAEYMILHGYTLTNLFGKSKNSLIELCKTNSKVNIINIFGINPYSKEMIALNLTYHIIKNNILWNDYLNY